MDEDRKKQGLPAYVPKRSVNSLEVENVSSARARERDIDDGLEDYEMTGLMAGSDDEGDGQCDCDVLEVEGSASSSGFEMFMNLGNFMCKPFLGFEFFDFSVSDVHFCGECDSDEEFDSCGDYDPYETAHMAWKAASHPTD